MKEKSSQKFLFRRPQGPQTTVDRFGKANPASLAAVDDVLFVLDPMDPSWAGDNVNFFFYVFRKELEDT
jgi:hypothetical protein